MKSQFILCLAALSAFNATPALATFVVDTGRPTGDGFLLGPEPFNSAAGFFTLDAATTITSAEWYIGSAGAIAGTIGIYDGSRYPYSALALFSADFTSVAGESWQGVFGQSWNLSAGSYWAALTMDGRYSLNLNPPRPLDRYASTVNLGTWTEGPTGPFGFNFGVRLADDVSAAVPEPASWILMIGGFGAIGRMMRYRRRRTSVSFG